MTKEQRTVFNERKLWAFLGGLAEAAGRILTTFTGALGALILYAHYQGFCL